MSVAMMRLCVLQIYLYSRRDGQKITLDDSGTEICDFLINPYIHVLCEI